MKMVENFRGSRDCFTERKYKKQEKQGGKNSVKEMKRKNQEANIRRKKMSENSLNGLIEAYKKHEKKFILWKKPIDKIFITPFIVSGCE